MANNNWRLLGKGLPKEKKAVFALINGHDIKSVFILGEGGRKNVISGKFLLTGDNLKEFKDLGFSPEEFLEVTDIITYLKSKDFQEFLDEDLAASQEGIIKEFWLVWDKILKKALEKLLEGGER